MKPKQSRDATALPQGRNAESICRAPAPDFDRVASVYERLETLIFRQRLQHARVAFIAQIAAPRTVLVAGEGNGRFLREFLRAHRGAQVDCVDASARMIELARQSTGEEMVRFICADILKVALPVAHYDLIVTHFFLDCFAEETLREVVAKLSRAAKPNATWLIADFWQPARDWPKLRARGLLAAMYAFFRASTGIEARRLVDYAPFLQTHGFRLTNSLAAANAMIRSQLWRRDER